MSELLRIYVKKLTAAQAENERLQQICAWQLSPDEPTDFMAWLNQADDKEKNLAGAFAAGWCRALGRYPAALTPQDAAGG